MATIQRQIDNWKYFDYSRQQKQKLFVRMSQYIEDYLLHKSTKGRLIDNYHLMEVQEIIREIRNTVAGVNYYRRPFESNPIYRNSRLLQLWFAYSLSNDI